MADNPNPLIVPLERITFLHIMLGNKCNHRCKMCFQPEYRSQMKPVIYRKRLAPLYRNLRRVVLQGGEPTILPGARELVERIPAINDQVKFIIMTNGHRFDDWWAQAFARFGERASFSLNAASRATYDTITRGGDWPATIANITRLVRLKRQAGPHQPQVAASFVVLKENLHEFSDFITFIRELGGDQVRFFFDPDLFPTDIKQLQRQLEKSIPLRDRIDIEGFNVFETFARRRIQGAASSPQLAPPLPINKVENAPVSSPGQRPPRMRCPTPVEGIAVDVDGRVRFCCMTEVYLGNLRKDPIEVIWNNPAAQLFRRHVEQGQYYKAGCKVAQCQIFD